MKISFSTIEDLTENYDIVGLDQTRTTHEIQSEKSIILSPQNVKLYFQTFADYCSFLDNRANDKNPILINLEVMRSPPHNITSINGIPINEMIDNIDIISKACSL